MIVVPAVVSSLHPVYHATMERSGRPMAPDAELDVRAEVCPYTFLRAKLALEPLAPGQVLRVLVGNAASARDVPKSLGAAGHAVLAVETPGPALWAILVRKRATA
jgi:TusA-related sulfurtransferase